MVVLSSRPTPVAQKGARPMTVPAPPAPAEKRPRKSAAGIALRVAGALLALLALVMAVGTRVCCINSDCYRDSHDAILRKNRKIRNVND